MKKVDLKIMVLKGLINCLLLVLICCYFCNFSNNLVAKCGGGACIGEYTILHGC